MVAKLPILIVGAGPVGLTLALALKRQGVDVRIIDKNAGPTDKSKALVVWPRTLELLDICGCAQTFVETGLKSPRARIFANGEMLLHVDLDSAPSDFGFALMIPQAKTESVLGAKLAALGVEVERHTELTSFIDAGDAGVSAVLRRPDANEERLECACLVGCDGAHSTVRHQLNAEFEGSSFASGYVLADIIIDGPIAHDETTICWASDGLLAIFPMLGGRFRIIADYGLASDDPAAAITLEQVQALLDARAPTGLKARDAVWTSRFTNCSGQVSRSRSQSTSRAAMNLRTSRGRRCQLSLRADGAARGRMPDVRLLRGPAQRRPAQAGSAIRRVTAQAARGRSTAAP